MKLKERMAINKELRLAKKFAKMGHMQIASTVLWTAYSKIAKEGIDPKAVSDISKQVEKYRIGRDIEGELVWRMINLIQLSNGIVPPKMEEAG